MGYPQQHTGTGALMTGRDSDPGKKQIPRILVADDDTLVIEFIRKTLEPDGHHIIAAENGQDAFQKVETMLPDLVILDITMPVTDGFEVLGKLKSQDRTAFIPVVMITAHTEIKEQIKAFDQGADDFLTKPVDRTLLKARVKNLLKVKSYNDLMRDYQKDLELKVEKKTGHLRQALDMFKKSSMETIYRLANAAEYRDEATSRHVQRISLFSGCIARQLNVGVKMVEWISKAASLHDVGKIGIPDRILLKPGKLDEAEWQIMKEHCVIGKNILENSKISFIKLAEIIAYTHHEKWDGSGYPRGLKGEAIPFAARITSLADAFDVMTSRRPYKEPFPVEKAFRIIREDTGTHFDPAVVKAFFAASDEILSIKKHY